MDHAERTPGFRQLSPARRARVLGLSAAQWLVDQAPRPAASLLARFPPNLGRALRAAAAPLRVRPVGAEARLDVETAARFLEARVQSVADGTPSVSIVVPTRGRGGWLRLCLAAVAAHTEPSKYEIVVVDDDAPIAVSDLVRRYPRATHLRMGRTSGFAAAVNAGVARCATERVVVLNDDAVVTPGWLGRLEAALDADPETGLVGPCSNDTGDVATVPAAYVDLPGLLQHAERAGGAPRRVAKLSLFCALMRREAYDAVGGLDEGYGSGMFEDDDLCAALWRRGFAVTLVPSAFVHHGAGATLRQLSRFEYLALFEVNRYRFEQRWGVRWKATVPEAAVP